MTLTKNLDITDWKVLTDETLSCHRYITYTIKEQIKKKGSKTWKNDFKNTDWTQYITQIKRKVQHKTWTAMDKETLDTNAKQIQDIIREVSNKYIKKVKTDEEQQDWWTQQLQEQRQLLRRKRREFQQETDEQRKRQKEESYKLLRNKYKHDIKTRKLEHINEKILNITDNNPWDKVWKFLRKPRTLEGQTNVRKEDGTFTRDENDKNSYLLGKYFPRDKEEEDNEHMKLIRHRRQTDNQKPEPTITLEEIKDVIMTMKSRKATAEDKIPNESLTYVIQACGQELTTIFNDCLRLGLFPKCWKVANVVWIPKKDGTPRPISLLPTLGKILDRLVNKRLQHQLETGHKIDRRQFGFREGMGTNDALHNMIDIIQTNKDNNKHQLLVTLDLANAFNSAWKPYVVTEMEKAEITDPIRRTCMSFLEDRMVKAGEISVNMEKGCPQGSSLGPTLWLLVMQGWFRTMDETNRQWKVTESQRQDRDIQYIDDLMTVQAYADDQIIVINGTSTRQIERKWNVCWEGCLKWQHQAAVTYNTNKTETLFINKTNIHRPPTIKIDETTIQHKEHIKYLGLTIDRKQNYIAHMKETRKKIGQITTKINGLVTRTWGRDKDILKNILDKVLMPAALYASSIWGKNAELTVPKRHLNATTRPIQLRINRAYRTTPNTALDVLTGQPPLWIKAKVEYTTYQRYRTDIDRDKIRTTDKVYPPMRHLLREITQTNVQNKIYVDATQQPNGRIGIGLFITRQHDRNVDKNIRLQDDMDIHTAEMMAIKLAIMEANRTNMDEVTISTDRKHAIAAIYDNQLRTRLTGHLTQLIMDRHKTGKKTDIIWEKGHRRENIGNHRAHELAETATRKDNIDILTDLYSITNKRQRKRHKTELTLQKWQETWDDEKTGRELYKVCKDVGLDRIPLTHKATQLVTGHGNMGSYIHRFKLQQTTGNCTCDGQTIEDVNHIKYDCTLPDRQDIRRHIQTKYGNLDIQLRMGRMTNKTDVDKTNEWADNAILD